MTDCCEPGCTRETRCPVHQALADLRAKVMGLRDRGLGTVLRSDVLALFPEEKP